MQRLTLAALLGGLVMFLWGAVWHMTVPMERQGIDFLSNDEPLVAALRAAPTEAGMYFFPGMPADDSDAALEEYTQKYATSPAGLLVYRPVGGEMMPPSMLVVEYVSNVLCALIAALVAAGLPGTTRRRVLSISAFGVAGWLATGVSHWNWYHFPLDFEVAEGIELVVGWLLVGLVVTRFVPGR
jgi:hypothetical protein